jgi:hypothetical protein
MYHRMPRGTHNIAPEQLGLWPGGWAQAAVVVDGRALSAERKEQMTGDSAYGRGDRLSHPKAWAEAQVAG